MHDKNAKLFFEKCHKFQTSNRTLNQMGLFFLQDGDHGAAQAIALPPDETKFVGTERWRTAIF